MKTVRKTILHLFGAMGGGVTTAAAKVRARKALNRAVASGAVVAQPCEQCAALKAQGHHDDYSKPLSVRWLCPGCHSRLHNQKHAITKACAACGVEFKPHPTKRARQVTCSPACFSARARQQTARFTVEQLRAIACRYRAGGVTQQKLADEFGCDRSRIAQIVNGRASRIKEVNDATR